MHACVLGSLLNIGWCCRSVASEDGGLGLAGAARARNVYSFHSQGRN